MIKPHYFGHDRWSPNDRVLPSGTIEPVFVRSSCGQIADLTDCRARRTGKFAVLIWEPLQTKAPSPAKTSPFCCYINTVIFYHSPYIVRPPRWFKSVDGWKCKSDGSFFEWDRTRPRLHWDDLIKYEGEIFEVQGGLVMWRWKCCWMAREARSNTDRARNYAEKYA